MRNFTTRCVFHVDPASAAAIDRAAGESLQTTSAWLRGVVADRLQERTPPPARQREAAAADAA